MEKSSAKAQLRSFNQQKAERINRAETALLNRRLKMIRSDMAKVDVKHKRQLKEVSSKLDPIKRNSGHSALRLKPKENDPHLKESSYFSEGRLMNEKKLQKWRYTEQQLQKQYKLTEMEEKKKNDYEEGMVKFLKDIGIIPHDSNVFKPDEDEPVGAVVNIEEDEILNDLYQDDYDPITDPNLPVFVRFPYAWNAINQVRPNSAAPAYHQEEDDFDMQTDSAQLIENYIKRVTSTESLSKRKKYSSFRGLYGTSDSMQTGNYSNTLTPPALNYRVQSAPQKLTVPSPISFEKPSIIFNDNQKSETKTLPVGNVSGPKKKLNFSDKKSTLKEKQELQLMTKQLQGLGFEKLPDWKRKVLIENPLAGAGTREKQKVRLTTSRAQMRRDLDRLVEDNKEDLEKLTIEINRRRYENLEAMAESV